MKISSQLRRLVPLAGIAALVGTFIASTTPSVDGDPSLGGIKEIAQQSLQGACDVDGVHVGYHTDYRDDPTYGYDVVDVVVSHIAWPSCQAADLLVELTVTRPDSTTAAATGALPLATPPAGASVVVGGGEATATFPVRITPPGDEKADVAEATSVAVTLDGGYTPVPPECSSMRFANIFVGTLGDDVVEGTNPASDLIYGLSGADRITSLQGNDCLVTGAYADGDVVTGGNGDNVVKTGAGHDTIKVGNGRNRIWSGDGNDAITVGSGKRNVIDAGAGNDTCYVPKSVKNKDITLISCTRVTT